MPNRETLQSAAILLAAGESTRMGRPKALLPWKGHTLLEELLECYRRSKVARIVVVGSSAVELGAEARGEKSELVLNPDPRRGPLSSIWTALERLGSFPDAVLVQPVDIPAFSAALFDQLLQSYLDCAKPIVIPTFQGRRGHPILFGRECFAALREAPLDVGARHVARTHPDWVQELPSDCEGIVADLNTPEDWRIFLSRNSKP